MAHLMTVGPAHAGGRPAGFRLTHAIVTGEDSDRMEPLLAIKDDSRLDRISPRRQPRPRPTVHDTATRDHPFPTDSLPLPPPPTSSGTPSASSTNSSAIFFTSLPGSTLTLSPSNSAAGPKLTSASSHRSSSSSTSHSVSKSSSVTSFGTVTSPSPSPFSTPAATAPYLSSSSSTPISASTGDKHVSIIAGTLVPLFVLALFAALVLYRRRRRQHKEWAETRVHTPDEDWLRSASVPPSDARHSPTNDGTVSNAPEERGRRPRVPASDVKENPTYDARGMDSPGWNGSDVLLVAPHEKASSAHSRWWSLSTSPSASPSPSPVPENSAFPVPDSEKSEKGPSDGSPASPATRHRNSSRAPTFVTVESEDRTPQTPLPRYTRPLPNIPFARAFS